MNETHTTHSITSILNVESNVSNETLENLRHVQSVAQAMDINVQYESTKHEDEEKVVHGTNIKWAFYDPMLVLRDTAAEDAFSFRLETKHYKFKDEDIKWLVQNTYPHSSKKMVDMVSNVMNYYEVVTSHIIWTGFVELLGRQTIAYLMECGRAPKILSWLAAHKQLPSVLAARDFIREDAMDLLRSLDGTQTRTETAVILGRCAATIVCHTDGLIPDQYTSSALDGAHTFSHLVERELVAMITSPLSIERPVTTFYSNNFWCEREFGMLTIRERAVHALAQAAKYKCILSTDLCIHLILCFKPCWMEGYAEDCGVARPEPFFHAGLAAYQIPSSEQDSNPTVTVTYLAHIWNVYQDASSWLTTSQTFKQSARAQPLDRYQMQLCMKYVATENNVHAMWALAFCLLFHQVSLPQKGLSHLDLAQTIVNIGQTMIVAASAMFVWAQSVMNTISATGATTTTDNTHDADTKSADKGTLVATKPIHLRDVCEKLLKICENSTLGLVDESTYASVVLLCAIYAYSPCDLTEIGLSVSPHLLCNSLRDRKSANWREDHVYGVAAVYRLLCSARAPPLDIADKQQLKEEILEQLFTHRVRELAAEALTHLINNNAAEPDLLPDLTRRDIANISRMRSHRHKLQLFSAVLSAAAEKDDTHKYVDICSEIPIVGAEMYEADEATSTAAVEFIRTAMHQGISMTTHEGQNAIINTLSSFGEVDQIEKLKLLKECVDSNKCFPFDSEQLRKVFIVATDFQSTDNVRYLARDLLVTYSQCVLEMKLDQSRGHRCVAPFEPTAAMANLATKWDKIAINTLHSNIKDVVVELHHLLIGGTARAARLPIVFSSAERLLVLFRNAVELRVYKKHSLLSELMFVWSWTTRCSTMMPFTSESDKLELSVEQFFVSFVGLLQQLAEFGEFDGKDKEIASLMENLAIPCPVITQLYQSVVECCILRISISPVYTVLLPEQVSKAIGELLNLAPSEYVALCLLSKWMDRGPSCRINAALAECLLVKAKDLDKRKTPAMALALLYRTVKQWSAADVNVEMFQNYFALFSTAVAVGVDGSLVSNATLLFCTVVQTAGSQRSLSYADQLCPAVVEYLVMSLHFPFDAAVATSTRLAIYSCLRVFVATADKAFDFNQLGRWVMTDLASNTDSLSKACILLILSLVRSWPTYAKNTQFREAARLKFSVCMPTSALFQPLLGLICLLADSTQEVTPFDEVVFQRAYDLLNAKLHGDCLSKCLQLLQTGLKLQPPNSEKHIWWGMALRQEQLLQDLSDAKEKGEIMDNFFKYLHQYSCRTPSQTFRLTYNVVYRICDLPVADILKSFQQLANLNCAELFKFEPAMNFIQRKIVDGEFTKAIVKLLAHKNLVHTVCFPDAVLSTLKRTCKEQQLHRSASGKDLFHLCLILLARQAQNCGYIPKADLVALLFSMWDREMLRNMDLEFFFLLMRKVTIDTLPKNLGMSRLFELYGKVNSQVYLDKIMQIFNPSMLDSLSAEESIVVQVLRAAQSFRSSVSVRQWTQAAAAMAVVDRLLHHNPVMTQRQFTQLITSAASQMISGAIVVQQKFQVHERCYTVEDIGLLDEIGCAALRLFRNYTPLISETSILVQIMKQYPRSFSASQLEVLEDLLTSDSMRAAVLLVHATDAKLTARCYVAFLRRQSALHNPESPSGRFEVLQDLFGHPELSVAASETAMQLVDWKKSGFILQLAIDTAIAACKNLLRDDVVTVDKDTTEESVEVITSWLVECSASAVRPFWQALLFLSNADGVRLSKLMLLKSFAVPCEDESKDRINTFNGAVISLTTEEVFRQIKCLICAGTWNRTQAITLLLEDAQAMSAVDAALLYYCAVDQDATFEFLMEVLEIYPNCPTECLISDTARLQKELSVERASYTARAQILIVALYCDIVASVAGDEDFSAVDAVHVSLQAAMLRLAGDEENEDVCLQAVVVAMLHLHNTVCKVRENAAICGNHFVALVDTIAVVDDCFCCIQPVESLLVVLQDVVERAFWRRATFEKRWRSALHEPVVSMVNAFATVVIRIDRAPASQIRDVYNFLLSKCKWSNAYTACREIEVVEQAIDTFVRCLNEPFVCKYVSYFVTVLRLWQEEVGAFHNFIRSVELLMHFCCALFRPVLDTAVRGQVISLMWSRRIDTFTRAFYCGWTVPQLHAFAHAINRTSAEWSIDDLTLLVSALDQVLQYRVPSAMVSASLLSKLKTSSRDKALSTVHKWCVDQTFGEAYELDTREILDAFCSMNPAMAETSIIHWRDLLPAITSRVCTDVTTAIPENLQDLTSMFARDWLESDWIFLLSTMSRAVNKTFKYFLRDTQLIAIAEMLHSLGEPGCNRRLLQMATSQGKSVVIAVVAAIHALCGRPVDICVSSALFATRDCEHFRHFYMQFGLKCATNNETSSLEVVGPKDCYRTDIHIVYGTTAQFCFDILRDEFKLLGTKALRPETKVLLIDEADNALLDEASSIARLAEPIPGFDHLSPVFLLIWHELQNILGFLRSPSVPVTGCSTEEVYNLLKWREMLSTMKLSAEEYSQVLHIDPELDKQIISFVANWICELLFASAVDDQKKIPIPLHLHAFVKHMVPTWVESAVAVAASAVSKDREYTYVASPDGGAGLSVAPIDLHSTGVTHKNTQWTNGLHRFVELQDAPNNVKFNPEGLTTNFLPTVHYVNRYEYVAGITATVGGNNVVQLMRALYGEVVKEDSAATTANDDCLKLAVTRVPSYCRKQCWSYANEFLDTQEQWLEVIAERAIREANCARVVLIVMQSVDESKMLFKRLEHDSRLDISKTSLIQYNESHVTSALEESLEMQPNKIIVATALAGRALDIKLSTAVVQNGGLHLMMTYAPANSRVLEQVLGRTSRKGSPGSVQIVLNVSNIENFASLGFEGLMQRHGLKEEQKCSRFLQNDKPFLDTQNNLFKEKFCTLKKEIKLALERNENLLLSDNNLKSKYIDLSGDALVEKWAIWLNTQLPRSATGEAALEAFSVFEKEMMALAKESMLLTSNPAYALQFVNMAVDHYEQSGLILLATVALTKHIVYRKEVFQKCLDICEKIEDPLYIGPAKVIMSFLLLRLDSAEKKVQAMTLLQEAKVALEASFSICSSVLVLTKAIQIVDRRSADDDDPTRRAEQRFYIDAQQQQLMTRSQALKLYYECAGKFYDEINKTRKLVSFTEDAVEEKPVLREGNRILIAAQKAGWSLANAIIPNHVPEETDGGKENTRGIEDAVFTNRPVLYPLADVASALPINSNNSTVSLFFHNLRWDYDMWGEIRNDHRTVVNVVETLCLSDDAGDAAKHTLSVEFVNVVKDRAESHLVAIRKVCEKSAVVASVCLLQMVPSANTAEVIFDWVKYASLDAGASSLRALHVETYPSVNFRVLFPCDVPGCAALLTVCAQLYNCLEDVKLGVHALSTEKASTLLARIVESNKFMDEQIGRVCNYTLYSQFETREEQLEVGYLHRNGYCHVYSMVEKSPFKTWTMLTIGSIAATEVLVSVALLSLGPQSVFFASSAMGLLVEAGMDIYALCKAGVYREHIWSQYLMQKAVSLGIISGSASLSAYIAAKRATIATTNQTVRSVFQKATAQRALISSEFYRQSMTLAVPAFTRDLERCVGVLVDRARFFGWQKKLQSEVHDQLAITFVKQWNNDLHSLCAYCAIQQIVDPVEYLRPHINNAASKTMSKQDTTFRRADNYLTSGNVEEIVGKVMTDYVFNLEQVVAECKHSVSLFNLYPDKELATEFILRHNFAWVDTTSGKMVAPSPGQKGLQAVSEEVWTESPPDFKELCFLLHEHLFPKSAQAEILHKHNHVISCVKSRMVATLTNAIVSHIKETIKMGIGLMRAVVNMGAGVAGYSRGLATSNSILGGRCIFADLNKLSQLGFAQCTLLIPTFESGYVPFGSHQDAHPHLVISLRGRVPPNLWEVIHDVSDLLVSTIAQFVRKPILGTGSELGILFGGVFSKYFVINQTRIDRLRADFVHFGWHKSLPTFEKAEIENQFLAFAARDTLWDMLQAFGTSIYTIHSTIQRMLEEMFVAIAVANVATAFLVPLLRKVLWKYLTFWGGVLQVLPLLTMERSLFIIPCSLLASDRFLNCVRRNMRVLVRGDASLIENALHKILSCRYRTGEQTSVAVALQEWCDTFDSVMLGRAYNAILRLLQVDAVPLYRGDGNGGLSCLALPRWWWRKTYKLLLQAVVPLKLQLIKPLLGQQALLARCCRMLMQRRTIDIALLIPLVLAVVCDGLLSSPPVLQELHDNVYLIGCLVPRKNISSYLFPFRRLASTIVAQYCCATVWFVSILVSKLAQVMSILPLEALDARDELIHVLETGEGFLRKFPLLMAYAPGICGTVRHATLVFVLWRLDFYPNNTALLNHKWIQSSLKNWKMGVALGCVVCLAYFCACRLYYNLSSMLLVGFYCTVVPLCWLLCSANCHPDLCWLRTRVVTLINDDPVLVAVFLGILVAHWRLQVCLVSVVMSIVVILLTMYCTDFAPPTNTSQSTIVRHHKKTVLKSTKRRKLVSHRLVTCKNRRVRRPTQTKAKMASLCQILPLTDIDASTPARSRSEIIDRLVLNAQLRYFFESQGVSSLSEHEVRTLKNTLLNVFVVNTGSNEETQLVQHFVKRISHSVESTAFDLQHALGGSPTCVQYMHSIGVTFPVCALERYFSCTQVCEIIYNSARTPQKIISHLHLLHFALDIAHAAHVSRYCATRAERYHRVKTIFIEVIARCSEINLTPLAKEEIKRSIVSQHQVL